MSKEVKYKKKKTWEFPRVALALRYEMENETSFLRVPYLYV